MVAQERVYTAEEFERFANLPENADRLFEFIGGEIVEVPSNAFVSAISITIAFFIKLFIREHNIEGFVTGEAGGYMVFGERYAPDVAFISKVRQPELAQEGYNPNPPDLAVEVDFPSTHASQSKLMIKLAYYLAAGTTVRIVYPETKQVQVYAPGQPPKILGINDTLDGGDVLPGFTLAVKDIFPA
ncbi:MAG: Uma2 family endonuclease [Chloroflexi bacterium]|nr:Uma2 family endonuclease [Chloroflexota bacterium]